MDDGERKQLKGQLILTKDLILKRNKKKRERSISLGFCLEVILFFLTGFFTAYRSYFAIILFFASLYIAFAVGEKIAYNAVLNYKCNIKNE